MELKSKLLRTCERPDLQFDSSIKGRYSSMYFFISLSNEIRDLLDDVEEPSPETYQAFSTYLHENIHWWQHIGSNFGFIFHSSFPSFATDSVNKIKELIEKGIISKSLIKYEQKYFDENRIADIENLNIIANNYHDLEYAKKFSMDNKSIIKIAEEDGRFFHSIGRCYLIMWSDTVHSYSDNFDKKFTFLPNFNLWFDKFKELELNKTPGFAPDIPMKISPLGIKAIFEGQAVFNQIVYLANVFKDNNIVLNDFVDKGLLHGVYIEAFEHFLRIIEEDMPIFIEMELIALFLLVCDLSINPTNGFPLDIYDFKGFIYKNDPGMRFISICSVIAENKGYYLKKCENQSKQTYIELSKLISKKIGTICPYESLSVYSEWLKNDDIKELIEEEKAHEYKNENMPFRLFFAKFLNFQLDKREFPEIFCWIGNHLSSGKNPTAMQLFEKHKALFIKKENGETTAMINDQHNSEQLYKTYNTFYFYTIIYELILKWISEEGEFKYDLKWLMADKNPDNHIERLKMEFKKIFGIEIEEITPL